MAQHDYLIENNIGRQVRTDINGALAALASNNAGAIEPQTPYPGMFWLDLTVPPAGLLRQRNLTNTGWLLAGGFIEKAIPTEVAAGVDDIKYVTPDDLATMIATARPMNLLVNPAMQISQENGDTAGTTNQYYPADQWRSVWQSGAGALSFQRVASVTPRGSKYRIRMTVTTGKPALSSGDGIGYTQRIEGRRIAHLGFGTAAARALVCRFGFRGPAGNYAFSLHNGDFTRCFMKSFSVSSANANKDIEVTIAIPGDKTGTWPTDSTVAMFPFFTIAAGSAVTTPTEGSWLAGNLSGIANMTNGIATTGSVFDLFDVGLYADPEAIGKAPDWEAPDESSELLTCQRYYVDNLWLMFSAQIINAANQGTVLILPVDMRVAPTVSGVNNGTPVGFATTVGTFAATFGRAIREMRLSTAAANEGRFTTVCACNARMA
jgi:hypothetical protein